MDLMKFKELVVWPRGNMYTQNKMPHTRATCSPMFRLTDNSAHRSEKLAGL